MKTLTYILTSVALLSLASCTDVTSTVAVKTDPAATQRKAITRYDANGEVATNADDDATNTVHQPNFTMSASGNEIHTNPNGVAMRETTNGSTTNSYSSTDTHNGTLYDNNNGAGVVGTNTSYENSTGTSGMQSPNISESNQNIPNTADRY
jgi:hypothetical protein